MNFNKILQTMWNAYFSCSKQTFYIIRMPISYSRAGVFVIFKYTSLQRSIGQPKVIFFYKFQKITDNQKKNLEDICPPT